MKQGNVGFSAGPNNGGTTTGATSTGPKEPVDFTNFLQHANHPAIVFFTLFFKIVSVCR
jgi:hypothetical protein